MRIIKKIRGKGLRKSKGLMFAYKCGLRILILHFILPTREQYKNKHTMSYIIQSVNLQTQVHYSELFFRSMGPQSLEGRRKGAGWFSLSWYAFSCLKVCNNSLSSANNFMWNQSCKNKLLLKKCRFLCLQLRTHHVAPRPPQNLWPGCPQINHTCRQSPPW